MWRCVAIWYRLGVPDHAAVVHAPVPVDIDAVVTHCNEHLADYKVPRYVLYTGAPLPRMTSGKIARREIRERYADVPATHARVR